MPRLDGRKLLVTRSTDDAADWAASLEAEGARPIVLPCITTESIDSPALRAELGAAAASADWLVATSRRGADTLAALVTEPLPGSLKLAAVGDATAAELRRAFGRVDHVGGSTAKALGAELATRDDVTAGTRIVLVLAENAGTALADALTSIGAQVERFDVYRTVPAPLRNPKRPLSVLGCGTVIFASPSAVTGFDNQIVVDIPTQMVTIGPSTSAAVRAHDWTVAAEAKEPSLAGIIDSMLEFTDV